MKSTIDLAREFPTAERITVTHDDGNHLLTADIVHTSPHEEDDASKGFFVLWQSNLMGPEWNEDRFLFANPSKAAVRVQELANLLDNLYERNKAYLAG